MEMNDNVPGRPLPVPAAVREGMVRAGPFAGLAEAEGKKKKKKDKKEKRAGSARGVETMFRTSYRTHIDMSQLADSKANIMISINGIIVSILIASISPKIDANPWLLLPTCVMLVACLVSMIYAVLSARPRVSRRRITLEEVRKNAANILFFGNFVNLSEEDYVEGMHEMLQDSDRLYKTMIRDIYSLGSVLERKFRLLRHAYTIFMIGLVLGVALFIIVFVGVVVFGPPNTVGAPI